MPRTDLNSAALNAVAYLDHQALLELKFKDGAVYRYLDVPTEIYGELLRAESKGAYFNRHIRSRFAHAKVRQEPTHSCDSDTLG